MGRSVCAAGIRGVRRRQSGAWPGRLVKDAEREMNLAGADRQRVIHNENQK